MSLPPLPEPFDPAYAFLSEEGLEDCPVFTADQMRAYGEARAKAMQERCANVADEHAERNYPWGSENTDRYHAQADWAESIASAIRGLKP